MKIILKKDVSQVGQNGKVLDVKFGFGKNWLIPQGLAILATPGALKQIQEKQGKLKESQEITLKQYSVTIEKLKKSALIILAKVTEKDNLYSHITSKNISDELKKQYKIDVNEKQIKIPNEIKHTGEHKITLELTPELTQELTVKIEKELDKTKDKIKTKTSASAKATADKKKSVKHKKTVKKTAKKE